MTLSPKVLFLPVVLFVTACAMISSGAGSAWAGPQDPVASGAPDYLSWPHEGSDLKPDPRVHLGVLPNGMRYAIMKNKQPAGTASVFLRITAGSMQEADDQQGFAHLLEHMAFLGSQNVSKGEMVKSLQRLGLSFGGDTNAQTGAEHTMYTLNPSAATPEAIEHSLFLLREIADRLTLSQDAVDTERGVVLAEERMRDTPRTRAWLAWQATAYDGLRLPHRDPIGKRNLIAHAKASQLRSFYERFYRPERALLIVVGDIDPDQIEGRVKALFSDWTQRGQAGVDPDRGTLATHPLRAAWFADPTLDESASIYWIAPEDRMPRSVARERRDTMRQMALQILNRRLSRLSNSPDAPFVRAWAGVGTQRYVTTSASLRTVPKPGRWSEAMQAVGREFRRMLQYGVQPEELASQLRELRSSQEDSVRNSDTRDNQTHAFLLAAFFESRTVYMSPEDSAALVDSFIPDLTVDNVNAALRDAFVGEPSLIFLQGPKAVSGGKQAILKVWNALSKTDVPPPAPFVQREFPYTDFGARGSVASTERLDKPGVTKIVFGNGVRLNVMSTSYEHERIGIDVSLPGGYLDFSPREQMLDNLYSGTWSKGGLGKIDQQGMTEATLGQQVSWYMGMNPDSYVLSGDTVKKDLLTQMRILAAYLVDPAFRGEALQQEQASNEMSDRSRRATASAALGDVLQSTLHSGDGRWTTPSVAAVNAVTPDDIRSRIMPALARRPIEITMVGDISVDAAIDAVAQTFGALARRDDAYAEPAGARDVKFPAQGKTVVLTHDGRRDQAILYLAWPGPDQFTDVPANHAFELLGQIIDNELTEMLRGQGKTYSPSSYAVSTPTFTGFGYLGVSVETSPQDLDGIKASVQQVIARLKAGTIPQDMIERARRPLIEDLAKYRKNNWYWRWSLKGLQRDPRGLAREQAGEANYLRATGETLANLARQYLQDDRLVELRVVPAH